MKYSLNYVISTEDFQCNVVPFPMLLGPAKLPILIIYHLTAQNFTDYINTTFFSVHYVLLRMLEDPGFRCNLLEEINPSQKCWESTRERLINCQTL